MDFLSNEWSKLKGNSWVMSRMGWMRGTTISLLCLLTSLFVSCGDDSLFGNYTYSIFPAGSLTIDNGDHLDPTLASAMNVLSPGVFCHISFSLDNGAKCYIFKSSHGGTPTKKVFNVKDESLENNNRIGYYNGLIVGFGNLDNPAIFFAYDAQCPNCFSPNIFPLINSPLTMSSTGIASCSRCERTYNLNTGGNIVKGDNGKSLYLYHSMTGGPNGILRVY